MFLNGLKRWVWKRFETEIYRESETETCILRVNRRDVRGHVTSSRQAKVADYVLTEENDFFF